KLVVKPDSRIHRHTPADAPVVLQEGFNIGVPVVPDYAAAFVIAIELAQERVSIAVLSVVGHGGRAGKAVTAQIGAGKLILFHLPRSLVVEAGLQVVLAPCLTEGIVETVNIVPVGVRTISAARTLEAGFVRFLPAKTEVGNADLKILAAR